MTVLSVEEAIDLAEELLGDAQDIPEERQRYACSAAETIRGIKDTIEERYWVTEGQERALHNYRRAFDNLLSYVRQSVIKVEPARPSGHYTTSIDYEAWSKSEEIESASEEVREPLEDLEATYYQDSTVEDVEDKPKKEAWFADWVDKKHKAGEL